MPLYAPAEPPEDELSPDEQWAALKTTIAYLREEAIRLGFPRVATALRRTIAILNRTRPEIPKRSVD